MMAFRPESCNFTPVPAGEQQQRVREAFSCLPTFPSFMLLRLGGVRLTLPLTLSFLSSLTPPIHGDQLILDP